MTKQIPKLLLLIAAFFVIGNTYSQTCPTGLVSYWKMDETSGLTLSDFKSGHNASTSYEFGRDYSGRVIYAQVLDTLKVGTVTNHSDYSFGVNSSFTIVYWMKFTEIEYGGQDHVIISKGDWNGGAPSQAYFSTGVNGSGKVNFLLSDNSPFKIDLESSLGYNDGAWHQVACVRDEATNKNILYVDGTVVDEEIYNYSGNFTNSYNILFGCLLNHADPGYYYKGSLDEVAIFNRALSSTEINSQRTAAITNGIGICDGLNPNIISIPNTKASVNNIYSYTVRAAGKQTGMTYSLVTKPSGMTITNGVISWTPASKSADGLVVVRADNGVAPADTQTFRIYISDQVVCPSGLISLHKLNETAGPAYADYYGAHNATASTSPTATAGKINGGQLFGAATKIDIPDIATEFDFAKDASFSIEFWMKTTTTDEMTALARFRTDAGAKWIVGTNSSGQANFELYDNSGNMANYTIVHGSSVLSNGAWHHVVAVRNGTNNTNKIYVDGVEENSVNKTYSNSFVADDPLPVTIGYTKRNVGDPEYHFSGSLDEVAIFNRALSGTEITSFYNAGNPTGHCAEGNSAPAFTSTAVTSATEDIVYTYNIAINDIDASDVLTLSVPTLPSWLTFNWTAGQKTATLTGTPTNANVGSHNVTLRVTDTHSPIDQTFAINVANAVDAPVITSTPLLTTDEDELYTYVLTVTDEDVADVISISAVALPSWLTFTYTPGAKTATISGTPNDANTGANAIDLSISDGHVTIHEAYTLTVNAVNDLPIVTGQSALSVNEDQSITLVKSNLTINDPDNPSSDLTLTVHAGTNYTYSGNSVTPASNYTGQLSVNVVVNDLAGSSAEYPVIITVTPVNDPPVITSSPELDTKVGDLYVYLMTATDVDNASIAYSAITIPAWLSFNATNGVLSGTPAISDLGQHLLILRASDGSFNIDQAFTLTVGTTAIKEAKDNEFVIYPVPVKDALNIRFSELTEETTINIINTSGSLIKSLNVSAGEELVNISLQDLKSGFYICHIVNSKMNYTSRFFIAR